jgi:integrase
VITWAALRRATDWDALLARLGYDGFRRHGLRHTGATWLPNTGIPLDVIARILGQTSPETTRTYVHIDGRQITNATNTFELNAVKFGQDRSQAIVYHDKWLIHQR